MLLDKGARNHKPKDLEYLEIIILDKVKDKGANIGHAIALAAEESQFEVVKLLLDKDAAANDGIEMAVQNGRLDVVKLLLEKGTTMDLDGSIFDARVRLLYAHGTRCD